MAPICFFQKCCVLCTLLSVVGGLYLGAFNAHVFGRSKAGKKDVMGILADIAARYDILLLQEIKDITGKAVEKLIQRIKQDHGITMSVNISDRLGRSSSKEQYAFLYRKDRNISVVNTLHFDDGDESAEKDSFQREPYIVRFNAARCKVKDFTLVALHTRPSQTVEELKALSQVVQHVKDAWHTQDIMILGDLNADCNYVAKKYWPDIEIRQDPSYWWAIDDDVDTTVNTNTDCAYDRFIITGQKLKDAVVTNSAQVFDFKIDYHLSYDEALAVSDHFPIELKLQDQPVGNQNTNSRGSGSGSQNTNSRASGSGSLLQALRHVWQRLTKRFSPRTSRSDL